MSLCQSIIQLTFQVFVLLFNGSFFLLLHVTKVLKTVRTVVTTPAKLLQRHAQIGGLPVFRVLNEFSRVATIASIGLNLAVKIMILVDPDLRETLYTFFKDKPVRRVQLFGSATRGQRCPESDIDLLVTLSPKATLSDIYEMAADVETAVARPVDFLLAQDLKNPDSRQLILETAVTVYVA